MDRLVESVDKLREDIAITEAQITAQLEETKAAKEALSEASMEIEVQSVCSTLHWFPHSNRTTWGSIRECDIFDLLN